MAIYVALSGQWSGMQSFSLIIYFYVVIRVLNTQIWEHNDRWIIKVSILEGKPKVSIFSILVAIYVALSGQWSGMQSFSLIIYFYVEIRVSNTQILSHNDPWILKVSILEGKP